MASINNIKPGQILYQVWNTKMGRTSMSSATVATYTVVSIDHDKQTVEIKNNKTGLSRNYPESSLRKFLVNKPILKELFTGKMVVVKRQRKEVDDE